MGFVEDGMVEWKRVRVKAKMSTVTMTSKFEWLAKEGLTVAGRVGDLDLFGYKESIRCIWFS